MNIPYKDDFLIELCKNKKVLDIGAVDSPYHLEKLNKGILLYQKLQNVCKQLIGIDIDKNAIKTLRERNIRNIFYGDIERGVYSVKINKKYDYIILGDVLEHLANPGTALKNIKKLMRKNTRLIVTVPNNFSYINIKAFLTGIEKVHPDHKFWPSVKTMCRLFDSIGFKIDKFFYCFWGSKKNARLLSKIVYIIFFKRLRHLLPCILFILRK
ncbi:MAG: class I SAM-dependent methyltransferase [Candidatus Methanomethylicia archaeon]